MTDDDNALLTGLVDNQLDEPQKRALRARLQADASLRARLAEIEAGGRPFGAAFDLLLDEAPMATLSASLEAADRSAPKAPGGAFWRSTRAIAAGLGIAVFLAGFGLGRLAPQWVREEDWRDAVAEYASLYTPKTFANAQTDEAGRAAELKSLSAALDVSLTPDKLKLDDLALKGAFALAYDGAPLGQFAYIEASGAPVLFCIIADKRADAPPANETRQKFALTTWARDGRGYMVIAQLPAARVAGIAGRLAQRF